MLQIVPKKMKILYMCIDRNLTTLYVHTLDYLAENFTVYGVAVLLIYTFTQIFLILL